MKKRIIIITSVVLILVIGVFFYVRATTNKRIYNGLSDRAKQFLAEREKSGIFNYNFETGSSGNKVDEKIRQKGKINDCFNFTIPFTVSNTYSQGKCSDYFSFDEPRGSIVAYLDSNFLQSLDDHSGVKLRRLQD